MADPLHARRAGSESDHFAGPLQRFHTGVDRLPHNLDRCNGFDAMHDLDRVAIRLGQADPLAAAGLVERLDARCAGQFRRRLQFLLAGNRPGEAKTLRVTLLGDMDVVHRIGAAHIQRRRRARRAHHAERGEEFLLGIEVRRPQPAIGKVGHLPGHVHPPVSVIANGTPLSAIRARNHGSTVARSTRSTL
jgi:hypothetical protein